TTKRDVGGTGLGLSVSYNIVKNHGGELRFTSKFGEGTTAMVILPVSHHLEMMP
ncbi:MAG: ATP-binding protein, partial [Candidatus Poribacteria bacterium]|nr:ATP-binding protein [Candidatus Poribacteria bacterium]